MMRAIFAALTRALSFIWGVITLPLRLFAPGPGRSSVPPPPDVANQIRHAIEQADEIEAVRLSGRTPSGPAADHAKRVMEWAAATLADRYATAERISTALPSGLRTWTLQLTNEHARLLIKAGLPAISAHLAGEALVDGVRPVRLVRPDDSRPSEAVIRSEPAACESRMPAIPFCS